MFFAGMSSAALASNAVVAASGGSPVLLADGTVNADLTGVTTVVTFLFSQFSALVTTIASQPLLLLSTGIFLSGAIIGLAKRLIH